MRYATAAALLLVLAACDYDPAGRCAADRDCLAGQVCASGVCAPEPPAPPNGAPAAAPDAYGVAAGVTLDVAAATGVLANDADPDGDALEAERASVPAHGTVFLEPDGAFRYLPHSGFTGDDTFTYRASDGTLRSPLATVTITVSP